MVVMAQVNILARALIWPFSKNLATEGRKVAIAGDGPLTRYLNLTFYETLGCGTLFAGPEEWRSQGFADYGQFGLWWDYWSGGCFDVTPGSTWTHDN